MASSRRPIPYNKQETMFCSYVGQAPSWFKCDDKMVEAYRFSSFSNARLWMHRRRVGEFPPVERVIAMGEDGCLYWMREDDEPIVLHALGYPDFSCTYGN
jgi:hypothetical protein